MDTPPPADLDDLALLGTLVGEWRLEVDACRYVPKGAGSYHWAAEVARQPRYFATVDDLDTKPWIANERNTTFEGLRTDYEAAWSLQHRAGLDVVVGPLRSREGSVIVRLSDQYSVALFPFVDGIPGTWGKPVSDHTRSRLLLELARIHRSSNASGIALTRRPLDVPERPLLMAAFEHLHMPWDAGALSERARRALSDRAEVVTGWLDELDTLARQLQPGEDEAVVTHGEPHPENLIQTDTKLRLIDWDTVALALPERDLWMLDDGSPDGFAPYEQETGRTVNDAAVRFYQLAWTLSDIASFAHMFRMPHHQTQWSELKWRGFERLLSGVAPTPYGPTATHP